MRGVLANIDWNGERRRTRDKGKMGGKILSGEALAKLAGQKSLTNSFSRG